MFWLWLILTLIGIVWALKHLRLTLIITCGVIAIFCLVNSVIDIKNQYYIGAVASLMAAMLVATLGAMLITREIEL